MPTATEHAPRSDMTRNLAASSDLRPASAGEGRTGCLRHSRSQPGPETAPPFSGWAESGAPHPAFSRLIRLHRHSLIHLLLVGGTPGERARLAFAFHCGSPLRRGPFVHLQGDRDEDRLRCALQCALSAVDCERSDDPLRESEGGTLFLDRVSCLSLATQHFLLRLLGSLPTPLGATWACFGRLAVGSAEPLEGAAAAGRFLPALFDILDKIRVELRSGSPGGVR